MSHRRLILASMIAAAGFASTRDGLGGDAGVPAATAAASSASPKSCDELEAAKNLTDPQQLIALSKCHTTQGKNADAWRATREALMYLQKDTDPDAGARTAAEYELERLAHLVGVVIVRAECETKPVTIHVDGVSVPSTRPIPLMPGAHKLVIACPMGEVTRDITIRAADKAEIEVPVDAWQKSNAPPNAPVRQPYGCGCQVVGLPASVGPNTSTSTPSE